MAVAVSLLCLSGLGATPAHAVPGRIDLHVVGDNLQIGAGVLATAVCAAHTNTDPGWVAERTIVWCTVNGYPSGSASEPGGDAVVTVVNATTAPVTICIYGQALLSSPLVPSQQATAQKCVVKSAGVYAE